MSKCVPRWPTCLNEFGEPLFFGPYKLIKYLGYIYGDKSTRHHHYLVQCMECGERANRIQNSLLKAVRAESKACKYCATKRDKKRDAKRRALKIEQQTVHRAEWIRAMMAWPVTDLELRHGFDNEKVWKLRKLPPQPVRGVRCLCSSSR